MRNLFLLLFLINPILILHAEKGLWLPKLDSLQWDQLNKLGLQLSAEEIYSDISPGLQQAVVRFGNGCSGVIVSGNGLLLTNHHCVIRSIESCSTPEKDYLTNGFWAEDGQEIPINNLSVKLLLRIINVTDSVLSGISQDLVDKELSDRLKINVEKIEQFLLLQEKENDETYLNVDKEWFCEIMTLFYNNLPENFHFPLLKANANNINEWTDKIYNESVLTSSERLRNFIHTGFKDLDKDPAVCLSREISALYIEKVWCCLPVLTDDMNILRKEYTEVHLQITPTSEWPDANGSMRLSYGTIDGYSTKDSVYPHCTTLEGLMEKNATNKSEYVIPNALKELYLKKDYGEYAQDGRMPVCFTATNHTVGGNSGSPVFNAYGELTGLNFDRNWEDTISDVIYDPSLCRNVVVDSHFILFIIEKFAGAHSLIDELEIKK